MRFVLNQHFTFWLIVIDILFLPYFNVVVIPLSYFVILIWIIKHYHQIMREDEIKIILLCMLLMFISTILGTVANFPYGVLGDNFKRLIQYYFAFGYYFFFKDYLSKNKIDLKNVLWFFVIFVVLLAIVFQSDLSLFVRISTIWNKGNAYNTSMIQNAIFGYTNRYNFIWTDTNNIAYAITGVVMFMLIFCKTTLGEKILLFMFNVFVLFCCMSSGGWIGFAISWALYIFYEIFSGRLFFRYTSKKSIIITLIVIIAICICIFQGYLSTLLNSDLVNAAMERLKNNEESRTAIWMRILQRESIFKYVLWGQGSEIYINGLAVATHSGHLYWIYAYGFISYIIFIQKFFWLGLKKIKRYIPLISFFLCFTMNTMVGEQKLLIILILFICYFREVGKVDEKIRKFDNSSI